MKVVESICEQRLRHHHRHHPHQLEVLEVLAVEVQVDQIQAVPTVLVALVDLVVVRVVATLRSHLHDRALWTASNVRTWKLISAVPMLSMCRTIHLLRRENSDCFKRCSRLMRWNVQVLFEPAVWK